MRRRGTDWLEWQSEVRPDNEALVCGDRRITYREFHRIAEQVAVYLTKSGVQRGDRVGVAMPKSVEYVCALFGIMKAGGCYVPIDEECPSQRARQIVDDCEMAVLISSGEFIDRVVGAEGPGPIRHALVVGTCDEYVGVTVRAYEDIAARDAALKSPSHVSDGDLAYILYTSGSTGKPKGVMVTHGNLMAFTEVASDLFELGEQDRVLNTAPFTFDIAGLDVYLAVAAGATLVVVPNQRMINTVLAAIHRERITFVSTVPTVIGALAERPRLFDRYDLSSVETFVSGAALCQPVFMRCLSEHLPNAKLFNLYGPTEATIYCLYHHINPGTLDDQTPVPIGVPFSNTEAYVVGDDGEVLPPGATGQLVVRGPLVAAGYFRDPERTAEVFRPFVQQPHLGESVYYTGDVVRQDGDGTVHFLGRRDDLIKSRGYRIELNEVEISMSGLTRELKEFSAVAVPDPLIEHRICVAVVLKQGATLTAADIIRYIKSRIPAYMAPEEVLFVDELPKTTSGKVSRKNIVEMFTRPRQ